MVARKFNVTMLLLMVFFAGAAQVPFTSGNIVVYRVGTGAAALTNAATAVFLDEYTPAGSLVQSIALPVAVSSSNQLLTAAGNGNSEGLLTLSADGQYLALTGYNAPVGTSNIASTASTVRPRTIGLVKYDATINTTTTLTDLSSSGAVRSAASSNGVDLWACGNGTGNNTGGVRYAVLGATTSTRLNTTGPSGLRCLNISNGQLYVAGNSLTPRIGSVGTGMPTTTGQSITNLPGFPTNGSPGQFVFADLDAGVAGPDVLYVADEQSGIEKYSLVAGSWTLNGTVGSNADDYRALTAMISGTTVTLFSMRRGANNPSIGGGELVTLTDANGYNGAFTGTPALLATAVTNNTSFRGVALAPQQMIVTPVRLMSLTVRAIHKDVQVSWSAASAVNFSHFEVERSANGGTFHAAGRVYSRPSNSGATSYSFTDAGIVHHAPPNGILYYRLKMTDADGRFEYSKVVAVFLQEKRAGLVKAYPTPFANKVWVKVGLISADRVHITLTDPGGRVIKLIRWLLPAGENTVGIDELDSLPKGTYLLRVTIGGKVTSIKLIK